MCDETSCHRAARASGRPSIYNDRNRGEAPMRSGLAWLRTALVAAGLITGGAGTAGAQAALDDDDDDDTTSPDPSTGDGDLDDADKTMIGAGVRLRSVTVPKGLIELFVEKASGGSSEFGFGLEIARRRGNFEIQFGVEYDKIFIEKGLWIDKGDELPADEPDFVEFENFGWITAEVTFLNH